MRNGSKFERDNAKDIYYLAIKRVRNVVLQGMVQLERTNGGCGKMTRNASFIFLHRCVYVEKSAFDPINVLLVLEAYGMLSYSCISAESSLRFSFPQ